MMNIVILDGYSANPGDLSWEELNTLGNVTVYDRTSPSETVIRAAEAEVVLTNKVVISHMELSGKLFGIIGLGNIGQRVAAIAHAFGMRVCALTSKPEDQLPSYVEKKSLEELFSESDIISLHCPLTPDTRHLINSETLQMMKPSAILINTGRGPLIDDQAVADALAEGRLAAFCADVLTEEPPKADNPLLGQPNAFTTPHIARASTEARIRLLQVAINNVRSFLSGQPQNVV